MGFTAWKGVVFIRQATPSGITYVLFLAAMPITSLWLSPRFFRYCAIRMAHVIPCPLVTFTPSASFICQYRNYPWIIALTPKWPDPCTYLANIIWPVFHICKYDSTRRYVIVVNGAARCSTPGIIPFVVRGKKCCHCVSLSDSKYSVRETSVFPFYLYDPAHA